MEGEVGWDTVHNGGPREPCAAAPALSEALGADARLWSARSPSELEDLVEDLKKDSASAARVVTLKDVEDGAFFLRQVGEAVASLKGELPPWGEKSEERFPQLLKICQTVRASFIHSFTHVCKYSSNNYMGQALLWTQDPPLNKIGKCPCLLKAYIVVSAVRFRTK